MLNSKQLLKTKLPLWNYFFFPHTIPCIL